MAGARERFRARGAALAVALGAALAGWFGPQLPLRVSPAPLFLNFGPNDEAYVRGFREDWERDGRIRFHWTTQGANVVLPLLVSGDGARLRLRARRHFVDPARVRLLAEGQVFHSFEIAAEQGVGYRVIEAALPRLEGRHPLVVSIEAPSDTPRPLGIALDWLQLEPGPGTRVAFTPAWRLRTALLLALLALALEWAGASLRLVAATVLAVSTAASALAAHDPLAVERIVREGTTGLVLAAVALVVLGGFPRLQRALQLEDAGPRGAVAALVVLATAVRLGLLLHPQFFYPDVRVHGLFARDAARRGLAESLDRFIENQFRWSLGLQESSGHWYAFPYPPGFYLLSAPLVQRLGLRHEVAVSSLAGVANAVEVPVVFALGRALGLGVPGALAGAASVPLLPLFLIRLSLGYFPALLGHLFDAIALLYLFRRYADFPRWRATAGFTLGVAAALLAYTQGMLNFGVLLALFIAAELAADRSPHARRRLTGIVAGCLAAGALAFGLFYYRYIPAVSALAAGTPMVEERILQEKLERERAAGVEGAAAAEEPDPYTGSEPDPARGLRKAGWRLWVFYGPFAPVVVAAVIGVVASLAGWQRRLAGAWALTYLVLNLWSGGLPGPNLLRYNKDLELVAPLACVGLGWLFERLSGSRRRVLRLTALALGLAWLAYGAARGIAALHANMVP
ncbi:MAG: hypothetical protein AB7O37_11640 [Vicinamibacteria bacterium]